MKTNFEIVEVLPVEKLLPEELNAVLGGSNKIKATGCNGHSCSCSSTSTTTSSSTLKPTDTSGNKLI